MNPAPLNRGPLLEDPSRRVILVGRTGLDQQLRKDPKTEIVRAPDALTALGELSDPPEGLRVARPVVVVGQLPVVPDPAGSAAELVEAMRRVEPRVLVLGTPTAIDHERYDGVLDPCESTDRLIELIESARPKRRQENGIAVEPEPSTAKTLDPDPVLDQPLNKVGKADLPDPSATSQAGTSFGPSIVQGSKSQIGEDDRAGLQEDDPTLIAEILRGKGIRLAALEIISRRLGAPVELRETDPNDSSWVAVMLGEVPAAWLGDTSGRTTPGRLEVQARWLAAWLRLEHQQRDLRIAAFTDPLTGAWNRRYFDRYLSATFEQARAAHLPVTVMMFDIDDFKKYNDRYGHAAGDEILCEAVDLLRSCIRPTDRVCRIGGDEFVVIFYEPEGPRTAGSVQPVSIYNIAMRFQNQICAHKFPKLGDQLEDTLTISGGLATFPWDGTTPEELLNRADELSLESKRAGKNVLTLGVGAKRACQSLDPENPSAEHDL